MDKFFTCDHPVCVFSTHSENEFTDHLKNKHADLRVPCFYCGKNFPANSSLTDHMIVDHGLRSYKCGYCPFRATTESHVKLHHHQQHLTKKHNILLCRPIQSGPLPSADFLVRPPDPSKLKPYVCGQGKCEFQSPYTTEFETHIKEAHRGISVFRCTHCKAEMIQPNRFVSHQSFHEYFTFYCFHCSYGSNSDYIVKLHVGTKHPDLPLLLISRSLTTRKKPRAARMISPMRKSFGSSASDSLPLPNGPVSVLKDLQPSTRETDLETKTMSNPLNNENTKEENISTDKLTTNALPAKDKQTVGTALSGEFSTTDVEAEQQNTQASANNNKQNMSPIKKSTVPSNSACQNSLSEKEAEQQECNTEEGSAMVCSEVLAESDGQNVGKSSPVKAIERESPNCSQSKDKTKCQKSDKHDNSRNGLTDKKNKDSENEATTKENRIDKSLITVKKVTLGTGVKRPTIVSVASLSKEHAQMAVNASGDSVSTSKVLKLCQEGIPDDDSPSTLVKKKCGEEPVGENGDVPVESAEIKLNVNNESDKEKIDQRNAKGKAVKEIALLPQTQDGPRKILGEGDLSDDASASTEILETQDSDGIRSSGLAAGSQSADDRESRDSEIIKKPDASSEDLDDNFDPALLDMLDVYESKQNRLRRAPSSVTRLYNDELCSIAKGSSSFSGKCLQCSLTFTLQRDLSEHAENEHANNCTYMCNKCDYTVISVYTMAKHLRTVHPRASRVMLVCPMDQPRSNKIAENYMCSKCPKMSFTLRQFHLHFKTAHPNISPLKCMYCQQDTFKEGFMKHLATVHPKKPPRFVHNYVKVPNSVLDGSVFKSSASVVDSASTLNGGNKEQAKTVVDGENTKVFRKTNTLLQKLYGTHLTSKKAANNTKVETSNRSSPNVGSGRNSETPNRHTARKTLNLPLHSQKLIRDSMQDFEPYDVGKEMLVNGEIERKRGASSGNALTTRPSQISMHDQKHSSQTHTIESPSNFSAVESADDRQEMSKFVCPFCEHDSKSSSSLRIHLKSELDYRPFRCRLCKVRTTRLSVLKTHLKNTHGTEDATKYRAVCNTSVEGWIEHFVAYTSRASAPLTKNLEVLPPTDVEIDALYCPYCKFQARGQQRTNNIIRHIRNHLRYTPFVCGYCKKSFTDYTSTVSHISNNHGDLEISYEMSPIPAIDAWIDNMIQNQIAEHSRNSFNTEDKSSMEGRQIPQLQKSSSTKTVSSVPDTEGEAISNVKRIKTTESLKETTSRPTSSGTPQWPKNFLDALAINVHTTSKQAKRSSSVDSATSKGPLAQTQRNAKSRNRSSLSADLDPADIPDFLAKPVDMNDIVNDVVSRTMQEIEAQPFYDSPNFVSPPQPTKSRTKLLTKKSAVNATRKNVTVSPQNHLIHDLQSPNRLEVSLIPTGAPRDGPVPLSLPSSLMDQGPNPSLELGGVPMTTQKLPLSPMDQNPNSAIYSGLFKCAYCNEGPGSLLALRLHWEQHHSELMFKVKRLISYEQGEPEKRDQAGVIKCSYCTETFPSISVVRVHCKQKHPGCAVKFVKYRRNQEPSMNSPNKVPVFSQPIHPVRLGPYSSLPVSHYGMVPKPVDKNKVYLEASIEGLGPSVKVPLSVVYRSVLFDPKVVIQDIRDLRR